MALDRFAYTILYCCGIATTSTAAAQDMLDHSDPLIVNDDAAERRPLGNPADPVLEVPTALPDGGVPAILLGAVQFTGLTEISHAALMQTVSPALGHTLDATGQSALLTAIELRMQTLGYPLATAIIEPQQVRAGVLRIHINEGRVDAVRIAGNDNPLISRMLSPIVTGGPVRREVLNRALVLAESVPGVRIVRSELIQEGNLNILLVRVREARTQARLTIDNTGTSTVGPVKLRGRVEHRSVMTAGDEVTVTAITTPADPGELLLGAVAYSLPLDSNGTRAQFSFSAASIDATGASSGREIDGEGSRAAISISHPIILDPRNAVSATLGFTWRRSEQLLDGALARNDRSSVINLRIDGSRRSSSARLFGHIALSQGTGLFDATRIGDPLASREDGDALFTKIEARGALLARLVGPLSLRIDGEAQVASRALLSSEEFGFGGSSFGRGYSIREATGDNALAGAIELRLDVDPRDLVHSLQLYGYGDAGKVWNFNSDPDRLLATAGVGLRSQITPNLGFGIELGMPVDTDQAPRGNFEAFWRF
jgi:hemolysin activation/secretion protein